MKRSRFVFLAVVTAALATAVPTFAQAPTRAANPYAANIFTDNMVLERGQSDPVWGWTTPGAKVTVAVNGKSADGVANADGYWIAYLPTLSPGGPYTMTVTGPQNVTFNNILVGDVWLCTGQSNMEFGIKNG